MQRGRRIEGTLACAIKTFRERSSNIETRTAAAVTRDDAHHQKMIGTVNASVAAWANGIRGQRLAARDVLIVVAGVAVIAA